MIKTIAMIPVIANDPIKLAAAASDIVTILGNAMAEVEGF